MKKRRIRTFLATLLFSIMLLSLGCGTPQNTNTTSNSNAKTPDANSADMTALAGVCSGNDVLVKKTKVEQLIQGKIDADPDFQIQQTRGIFKFQVETEPGIAPQSLYVYLAGGIGNVGTKYPFSDLMAALKTIHKLKCVNKVIFAPPGSIPFVPTIASRPQGFDWFGCEDPNVPCPGGICAPTCMIGAGNSNGNTSGNTRSNANSNSTSNSNSNSNSNSSKPSP